MFVLSVEPDQDKKDSVGQSERQPLMILNRRRMNPHKYPCEYGVDQRHAGANHEPRMNFSVLTVNHCKDKRDREQETQEKLQV